MPTTRRGLAWPLVCQCALQFARNSLTSAEASRQARMGASISSCPKIGRARRCFRPVTSGIGADPSHPPADNDTPKHRHGHVGRGKHPSTILPQTQRVPRKRGKGAEPSTNSDRHEEPHRRRFAPKFCACHRTPSQQRRGKDIGAKHRPRKGGRFCANHAHPLTEPKPEHAPNATAQKRRPARSWQ